VKKSITATPVAESSVNKLCHEVNVRIPSSDQCFGAATFVRIVLESAAPSDFLVPRRFVNWQLSYKLLYTRLLPLFYRNFRESYHIGAIKPPFTLPLLESYQTL
jgi:hypothetical protein